VTATPLTDQQLADIRGYHERTTHPDWRDETHVGLLLTELGRVRAELADARKQTAEAIVAGLAAIHDHSETAERNRPGLRMAMRNAHRFVAPPTAAVPSA
jgi:hypothetical protein